jgi:hypothetical protein
MRGEEFRLQPRHSTSLQLARIVERVTRNIGEKNLTVDVFHDVAKAFVNVWIDGLIYKLTLLNFPSYIVCTYHLIIPPGRPFEGSFQTATSSRRGISPGVVQGGLISSVLLVCTPLTCSHPRTTPSWPSTRMTRPS